ncbi:hypothetical protein BH23PLA1_BH23PLA1_15620 [soil metagenome]
MLDAPTERISASRRGGTPWLALGLIVTLGLAHILSMVACMGGWSELAGPDPLAWHDHPMHLHNAVITRDFLWRSGTTAGYDPSFMAGYAKSIVSDPSGTAPELFVALFGRSAPVVAYKIFVFLVMASIPWLIAWATAIWGGRLDAVGAAMVLALIFIWTDAPLGYAELGMVSYLLAIPLGVMVAGWLAHYIDLGGRRRWALAALGSTLLVLVHPLSVMVVAPAAWLAYGVTAWRRDSEGLRLPLSRHVGVWTIPLPVLLGNAFWWYPGLRLSSTSRPPDLELFSHREPVWERLGQIVGLYEPAQGVIQAVLLAGSVVGLVVLARQRRILALTLGGFLAAGFGWGYLAGAFRWLDFLQPGRHTYALYTGAIVATSLAWAEIRVRIRATGDRLDRWLIPGLILIGLSIFGPMMAYSFRFRTAREPILSVGWTRAGFPEIHPFPKTGAPARLSSRPTRRWLWLRQQVEQHFQPGDRLLYEEGGRAVNGLSDPFGGRRYGGLLPTFTGVEVIGGPFLHVPLRTNFTQFGEGRLFGREDWDREHFLRYARLYRPSAIVCWSPRARGFCRSNPDLIEVLEEEQDGPLLIARVKGFEGPAIQGRAEVVAEPGRLRVRIASDEVDGLVVLGYHSMPCLRSRPPVPLETVQLEGDPVPFIGIRPTAGPLTLELMFSP